MKFQHLSIPTDDSKKAAEVLSKIFDGEITRFPPGGPDAWMVWSKDGFAQVQCCPRGDMLVPDPDEVILKVRREPSTTHSEVHIGIMVDKPQDEIMAIAKEAGWPAYPSVRIPGENGFSLLEVWVEGKFLLEFVDPVETPRLMKAVTLEGWKSAFNC